MRIRSFQGLVPTPAVAADVAAVPYDVVNREESYALAHDKPLNLLHVDRAEIDLPLNVDPYDAQVYAKAVENFKKLQADGVLVRETGRCMYLYRQSIGGHGQTGLVTTCHIDDYQKDIIKKHEKTRQDKEDDRTRLVDAFLQDLPGLGLLVEHQLIVVFRHVFLALLIPDAHLAEEAFHAEGA